MKKEVKESLSRMQHLMEFHFKPHGRSDSEMTQEETPVKFHEVGDVYKHKELDNDYPAYESYRDEVIIDEDDPKDGEQPVTPPEPAPIEEPAPQPVPPAPQAQEPIMPAQQPAPPAPVEPVAPPAPEPTADPMMGTLSAQIAKTDELLAKFDQLQSQLSNIEDVNIKMSDVEKKIEDVKNPSYDQELEMISRNSYPYNVKLSDFWGWDDEDGQEEKEIEYKVSSDEINNYNKEDIKKSFDI